MLSQESLLGAGGALLLLGALLWNLPRAFNRKLSLRRDYAAKLRVAGEAERAARLDAETDVILRRVPIYGRVIVTAGIAALVAAWFVSRASP